MALTPEDLIRQINREGSRALRNGISRFDMEWGRWSSEMNSYLTKRIEANDPELQRLKDVFYYWTLMSRAIEYAFKKKSGLTINENQFSEVVSMLEHMKEQIDQGVWPNMTLADIEKTILGVSGDL